MTTALPPNVVGYTQADWANQVLQDAGLPQTQNNINNIVRWMVAEEPANNWWDRNNPLNASLGTTSTSGLGSYPDLSTGASYTAKMIRQSNMSGIANALSANADSMTFSSAVVASPWASGHYGGNPNAIANIPLPSFIAAGAAVGNTGGSGGAGGVNPDTAAISVPFLGTILNVGQELKIKGWFLMIAGGGMAVVGLAVVLASLGLDTKAGRLASSVVPGGAALKAGAGAAAARTPSPSPSPASAVRSEEAARRRSPKEQGPSYNDVSKAFESGRKLGRDEGAQEGFAEAQYEKQTPADRAANKRAAADFRGRPRRQPSRRENLPPERTRAG